MDKSITLEYKGVELDIDYEYEGQVGVILINHGFEPVTISKGDPIAQARIDMVPVGKSILKEAPVLGRIENNQRGEDGYGSSGTVGGKDE